MFTADAHDARLQEAIKLSQESFQKEQARREKERKAERAANPRAQQQEPMDETQNEKESKAPPHIKIYNENTKMEPFFCPKCNSETKPDCNFCVECGSYLRALKNICCILKHYKALARNQAIHINADKYYNAVDLLNDFNHLLLFHGDHFEEIYNIMNKAVYDNDGCNLSKCLFMRRHQRNRSQITRNENILNDLYSIREDIVSQQLLDRVHCHFFHSFDIGYKLTKNQQNKPHEARSSDLADYGLKQRKFQNTDAYNFGQRFYYWPKFGNMQDGYDPMESSDTIPIYSHSIHYRQDLTFSKLCYFDEREARIKHRDLKSELLQNNICRIGGKQWQNMVKKVEIHYKTQKVKTIACGRFAEWYEMEQNQVILEHHLIAMSTYCNYTLLSFKFSETYRKLNGRDDLWNIRQRHLNYYWLGRYLRECVDCFGMEKQSKSLTVYHGVSKQFTFESIYAHIKCPFSTTTEYAVALNFCEDKGMILELNINESDVDSNRWSCCDMSWISDFSHEEEIFCIGGLYPLKINNIMEPTMNYAKYMNGLKQICSSLQLEGNVVDLMYKRRPEEYKTPERLLPSGREEKQLYFSLISHEMWRSYPLHPDAHEFKGCPEYFKHILHLHFQNITCIYLTDEVNKINDRLFLTHNKWIHLELLTHVFPKVNVIMYSAMERKSNLFTNSAIYDYILSFIKKDERRTVHEILIRVDGTYYEQIQQEVRKHQKAFEKEEWEIDTDCSSAELLIESISASWFNVTGIKDPSLRRVIDRELVNRELVPFEKEMNRDSGGKDRTGAYRIYMYKRGEPSYRRK